MANSLLKLFWIVVFAAVFVVVFLFSLINAGAVELNLFFYRYEMPLAAVCWFFLLAGVLLGSVVMALSQIGGRISKWAQSASHQGSE